jgi:hypothetical protein
MDSREKSPGVSFSSKEEIANRYGAAREGGFRGENVKIGREVEKL